MGNNLPIDMHLGQGRRPERDGEIMACGMFILVVIALAALVDLVLRIIPALK